MKKQLLYEINRMKSIMGISEGLILEQPTSLIPKPLLKSIINASDDAADFVIKLFKGSGDEENDLLNKLISKNNKVDDEIIDLISSKLDNESFDLLSKILKQKNLLGSDFPKLEDLIFNILNKKNEVDFETLNKAMISFEQRIKSLNQLEGAPQELINSIVKDARKNIEQKLGTKYIDEFSSELRKTLNETIPTIDETKLNELKRKEIKDWTLKDFIPEPAKFLYTFWSTFFKKTFKPKMDKIDNLILEIENLQKSSQGVGTRSSEIESKTKELVDTVIGLRRVAKVDIKPDIAKYIFNNPKIPIDIRNKIKKNELLTKQLEMMNETPWNVAFKEPLRKWGQMLGLKTGKESGKWSLLTLLKSVGNFILWKDPRSLEQVAVQVAARGGVGTIKQKIISTIFIQYFLIPWIYAMIKKFYQASDVQQIYAINVARKLVGLEPIPTPPFMSENEFWDSFLDAMPIDYREIWTKNQEDSGKPLYRVILESFTYTDDLYRFFKNLWDKFTSSNIPEENLKKEIDEKIKLLGNFGLKIDPNKNLLDQVKDFESKLSEKDSSGLTEAEILKYIDKNKKTFLTGGYLTNNLSLVNGKWTYKDKVTNKYYTIIKVNGKLYWSDDMTKPLEW
jgi:hypothetical protein